MGNRGATGAERPLPKVLKEYAARGPMQQFRLEAAAAFHCFRCGADKVSKLVTVYGSDWKQLLCNGCYGRLLSIFTIKKGTEADDVKAEALSRALLELVTNDEKQQMAQRMLLSENRATYLSETALRFLATSECVSQTLGSREGLDWSAAVIGLCKAVELEFVKRVIEPLKKNIVGGDFSEDLRDKDLSRIAKYCAEPGIAPPELGSIRHFLQTAANSKRRVDTSILLRALSTLVSRWPKSSWLFSQDGALTALETLTTKFRNRAAHTDELNKSDYDECRNHVLGEKGTLWMLILASQSK